MTYVTLIFAAIAAVVAWRGTPMQALYMYLGCLLWYPEFLSAPLGSLDFTASRILVIACTLKIALQRGELEAFRPRRFDLLILLIFSARIFSITMNESFGRALEAVSGNFCNTVLPYFLVRITIRTRERLDGFLRAFVILALPLAVLGCIQCVTGFNPYGFMRQFSTWTTLPQEDAVRWGLFRATVTFDQYIAFGLFFAAVLPFALAIRAADSKRNWKLLAALIILGGVLSSMSTAPMLATVVSISFLLFYPFRRYAAVLICVVIASLIFLEFASDRHFYEVGSRFAMDASTAYDRVGLYKEAFGGGMSGHWIFGYGFVGVGAGNTNTYFDWEYKDFTSYYIEHLVKYGLVMVIPQLLKNIFYYVLLYRCFKALEHERDKWTVWCVAATLIGWNVAMLTVTTISVLPQLFYMFVALAASVDVALCTSRQNDREYFEVEPLATDAPLLAQGKT